MRHNTNSAGVSKQISKNKRQNSRPSTKVSFATQSSPYSRVAPEEVLSRIRTCFCGQDFLPTTNETSCGCKKSKIKAVEKRLKAAQPKVVVKKTAGGDSYPPAIDKEEMSLIKTESDSAIQRDEKPSGERPVLEETHEQDSIVCFVDSWEEISTVKPGDETIEVFEIPLPGAHFANDIHDWECAFSTCEAPASQDDGSSQTNSGWAEDFGEFTLPTVSQEERLPESSSHDADTPSISKIDTPVCKQKFVLQKILVEHGGNFHHVFSNQINKFCPKDSIFKSDREWNKQFENDTTGRTFNVVGARFFPEDSTTNCLFVAVTTYLCSVRLSRTNEKSSRAFILLVQYELLAAAGAQNKKTQYDILKKYNIPYLKLSGNLTLCRGINVIDNPSLQHAEYCPNACVNEWGRTTDGVNCGDCEDHSKLAINAKKNPARGFKNAKLVREAEKRDEEVEQGNADARAKKEGKFCDFCNNATHSREECKKDWSKKKGGSGGNKNAQECRYCRKKCHASDDCNNNRKIKEYREAHPDQPVIPTKKEENRKTGEKPGARDPPQPVKPVQLPETVQAAKRRELLNANRFNEQTDRMQQQRGAVSHSHTGRMQSVELLTWSKNRYVLVEMSGKTFTTMVHYNPVVRVLGEKVVSPCQVQPSAADVPHDVYVDYTWRKATYSYGDVTKPIFSDTGVARVPAAVFGMIQQTDYKEALTRLKAEQAKWKATNTLQSNTCAEDYVSLILTEKFVMHDDKTRASEFTRAQFDKDGIPIRNIYPWFNWKNILLCLLVSLLSVMYFNLDTTLAIAKIIGETLTFSPAGGASTFILSQISEWGLQHSDFLTVFFGPLLFLMVALSLAWKTNDIKSKRVLPVRDVSEVVDSIKNNSGSFFNFSRGGLPLTCVGVIHMVVAYFAIIFVQVRLDFIAGNLFKAKAHEAVSLMSLCYFVLLISVLLSWFAERFKSNKTLNIIADVGHYTSATFAAPFFEEVWKAYIPFANVYIGTVEAIGRKHFLWNLIFGICTHWGLTNSELLLGVGSQIPWGAIVVHMTHNALVSVYHIFPNFKRLQDHINLTTHSIQWICIILGILSYYFPDLRRNDVIFVCCVIIVFINAVVFLSPPSNTVKVAENASLKYSFPTKGPANPKSQTLYVYGYGQIGENTDIKKRARGAAVRVEMTRQGQTTIEIVRPVLPEGCLHSASYGITPPHPTTNSPLSKLEANVGRMHSFIPDYKPETLDRLVEFVKTKFLPRIKPLNEDDLTSVSEYLQTVNKKKRKRYITEYLRFVGKNSASQRKDLQRMAEHGMFVKSEFYEAVTDPRGIYTPGDLNKCFYGWMFSQIEFQVYQWPEVVKHIPVAERAAYIKKKLSKYSKFLETDFTSLESSITKVWMEQVEFMIYKHFFSNCTESTKKIVDGLLSQLSGTIPMCTRQFKTTRVAGRQSGDMNTSLGNLLTNIILISFLFDEQGIDFEAVFEGDDALINCEQIPNLDVLAELGFKVTFDSADEIGHLSFCGMKFSESGQQMSNPFMYITKLTYIPKQYMMASQKTKDKLVFMKCLSALFERPECPMVSAYCHSLMDKIGYKFSAATLRCFVAKMNIDEYQRKRYNDCLESRSIISSSHIHLDTRLLFEQTYGVPISSQIEFEKDCFCEYSKNIFLHFCPVGWKVFSDKNILPVSSKGYQLEVIESGYYSKSVDQTKISRVFDLYDVDIEPNKLSLDVINELIKHRLTGPVFTDTHTLQQIISK